MFFYNAFGLILASEIALPELPAAPSASPDVTVCLAPRRPIPARAPGDDLWLEYTAERAELVWPRLGLLTAQHGREMIITPAPDAQAVSIRLFIIGPLITAILHQRGKLVLHASAVAVNGGALLFLGASGKGKSSTAAALLARGHSLVTDDVAALDLDAEVPAILPAFPRLKIGAQVAAALGYDAASLPPLHADLPQRRWLSAPLHAEALPLKAIYVLDDGDESAVVPLLDQEALIELVRHACPTRWGLSGGATHFLQLARLVQTVPLYRLRRPRDLAVLPSVARLVEQFATNQIRANPRQSVAKEESSLTRTGDLR